MARTELVKVSSDVLSSYGPGGTTVGPRSALKTLRELSSGRFTLDTCVAVEKLHDAVTAAGGDFRVTDGFRNPEVQGEARRKYERWLAEGKPSPADSTRHKTAFVAQPGKSFHNGGRAIDIHIEALKFPGLPDNQQLDRLWSLAIPLGWRAAIKAPTEGAKESWHFDFMGEWGHVADRLGYEQAAIGACLDVGGGSLLFSRWQQMELQAQLQRAGYDCGAIDGAIGERTKMACYAAGIRETALSYQIDAVRALTSAPLRWS